VETPSTTDVKEALKDYAHSYLHPHLTLNATAADSSYSILYPALMSLAGGADSTAVTASTATFHADFQSSPSAHPGNNANLLSAHYLLSDLFMALINAMFCVFPSSCIVIVANAFPMYLSTEVDFAEDLEQSFELHLDPEIAHQASRLLEENELTEEDFNELFPEARSDHKLELGLDFPNNFDPADIDIDFANIFPFKTANGEPPF